MTRYGLENGLEHLGAEAIGLGIISAVVPQFVVAGEKVRVNKDSSEYMARA